MRLLSLARLVFLLISLSARAAETRIHVVPKEQTATLSWNSDFETDKAGTARWKAFCEHLGHQLLARPGPGFLSSYECQAEERGDSDIPWRLRLIEHKDSFAIKVSYVAGGEEHLIRDWTFVTKGSILANISSDFLPVLIARMITENMPTGFAYRFMTEPLLLNSEAQVFPLPPNLLLYDLSYSPKEKAFIPHIYARLIKSENGDKADEGGTYEVEKPYRPLKARRTYWVRGLLAREREIKYEKMVTNALQGEADLNLPPSLLKEAAAEKKHEITTIRSSYAGLRYGKSVLTSDSLVTQLSMLSAFAELGTGPLAGLRLSYDLYPEIRRGSGDAEEYFGMKRISLGYSFTFKMPEEISDLVDTIDIQPKIGLVSLKSHFYAATEDGRTGLDFNVKNVYDLAVEGGLEKNTSWFRARVWGGFSTANVGISSQSATKVQSRRAGLDLYYDLLKWQGFDVNVLGFTSLEHIELAKDPNSLDASHPGLYSFGSNLVFAGLGFTVSW